MPLLNLRVVRPAVIIDIGRVYGLNSWTNEGDTICIGAFVRQRAIESDKSLAKLVPLLTHAIDLIGHPATRSRGTIVGSMCHADPAAELPVCAVLLKAEFVLRSTKGTRSVEANDFFQDALCTAAGSDEIVEAVRLPVRTAATGYAFDEVARRYGDFALVSVAAAVNHTEARIAIGGVAGRPLSFDYRDYVKTEKVDPTRFGAFANSIAEKMEPNSDLHASADYRRSLATILVERTLIAAFRRIRADT